MNATRSLRIVLATVGSRGDVQPMLALAQVLQARGHVPVVAAPVNFASWVRGLGFAFAPLGEDMQVFLADNPQLLTGNPLAMARRSLAFFKTHVPLQAPQLMAACLGADALVYAGLSVFFAPSVAQARDLPAMQLQFTTCMLPSASYPPPAFPWHGLPGVLNRALWWLHRRGVNRAMLPTLNRMRADLSVAPAHPLPELDDAWHHLLYSCPLVIAADRELLPPDAPDQPCEAYANFLFLQEEAALDPALEDWLDAGEPPVYIGFGSMSGAATARLDGLLRQASGGLHRRCLIGAGWAGLATRWAGSSGLPQNWRVVQDAPHGALFKRVAVVVHHGGSGTTAQALRAGVPQVVLPLILDQFHHAHRLHVCGLTPRPVPMEQVTALQLRRAIDAALEMPDGPRQRFAQRLAASNAAQDIALRLEAQVQAHKHGHGQSGVQKSTAGRTVAGLT